MPFANGSRSGLSYVVESTFGTTPGTPALLQLPYNTHSINLTKDRVQGNEILPDRMIRTDRHGNRQVAGDITVDLRSSVYDAFLESGMMGAWTTNVLKNGTTPKFFSIEDAAEDISQFSLFTGCTVNSMAFSIKPNQMVTTTFSVIGKDMTISGTSVDATKTAAAVRQPFDAYSGALTIGNAGGALSANTAITGIDFTVTNGYTPAFVVGSSSTPELLYGMATVEGTITAYFENANLINRFINETETGFQVNVDDPTATRTYQFLFPRVKFNGAEKPVDGPEGRIITIPFVAIYDTTENTMLKITRPASP